MREYFLQIVQAPRSAENSTNIMRVLNSLNLEDFRQIMTTDAEKVIVRKALFKPLQAELINAMKNRITRLDDSDLLTLFLDFERENRSQEPNSAAQQSVRDVGDAQDGAMIARYNITAKIDLIRQSIVLDARRVVSFTDSDHPDTISLQPEEGVAQIFVGQRNTDVPVSCYLHFFRSYLESRGDHQSARNMVARLSFSENGNAKPFFHLNVDRGSEDAIFYLNRRLFVVSERGKEIAKKDAEGNQSFVYFILTGAPTTVEAISMEWPGMVVFSTKFERSQALLTDDAQPPLLAPPPPAYWQAPVPVAPAFINPLPPSVLSARASVGMFPLPPSAARRAPVVRNATRPTEDGREIIPANAEVPQPSFMGRQVQTTPPTVPLPLDPLVEAMRIRPMVTR